MHAEFVVLKTSGLERTRQVKSTFTYTEAERWLEDHADAASGVYVIEKRWHADEPWQADRCHESDNPKECRESVADEREPFLFDGSQAER